MPLFSNWNGKIVENTKICISPDNRSFRYGDGCFETIKVINGRILLADLHFQRLFSSLQTLKFSIPASLTPAYFESQIKQLVQINEHEELARVRLVVYAGEGALYDVAERHPNFIIQSWIGNKDSIDFNDIGLILGIFWDARKTADVFSCIKSNNYLGYVMGAIWGKQNGLDDCILTNAFNRVADATIANIFIVSDGIVKTPTLAEGCVNGVMRKYLLACLRSENIPFLETEISFEEVLNASEIFLTNANYGVRWVQKVGNSSYSNSVSSSLHKKFISPLFTYSTF